MKTITIGRGDGADIIIDDEMISRRHAILKISTFGKMEIVDMGKNGTFVNGIKLRPNVPFPVTRKDVINFAEITQLDWSLVPNNTRYIKYGIVAIIGLLLIIIFASSIKGCEKQESQYPASNIETTNAPVNSNSIQGIGTGNDTTSQRVGKSESSNSTPQNRDTEEENTKSAREKNVKGKTLEQLFPNKKKTNPKDNKDKAKTKNKPKQDSDSNNTIIMP